MCVRARMDGEPRATACEDERAISAQYAESVAANKSTGARSIAHLLVVVAVAGPLVCALVVVAGQLCVCVCVCVYVHRTIPSKNGRTKRWCAKCKCMGSVEETKVEHL